MIQSLEHTAIVIRDLEACVRFYQGLLGAEIIRTGRIESSGTDLCYLQIGEGVVELLARSGAPSYGLNHIAFMVDELDATYREMSGAGIEFSVTPKRAGSGFGRVAFFSDPDAIREELLEQPKLNKPLDALSMNPHLRDTDHVSLLVQDVEQSTAFYERFAGARVVKRLRNKEEQRDLLYLECGKNIIELASAPESFTGRRIARLALRVDSVEATVRELSGAGVRLEEGPRDAATGLGREAVVLDPEGNPLLLLDRPDLRTL